MRFRECHGVDDNISAPLVQRPKLKPRNLFSIGTFEGPVDLSIIDRPPHDDFVAVALLDIDDVYRPVYDCPFGAGFRRRGLRLFIALRRPVRVACNHADCAGGHACDASAQTQGVERQDGADKESFHLNAPRGFERMISYPFSPNAIQCGITHL